ncbi:MAG: 4-(cytidine 5'-diphospho)-2-C-methyl-D-erythritol kinase [Gammaproteobacteria bacterium]|nr:4-(cytidine 5'-diphospho)-2-C-methyl-D-erythritol kinase [Gammaproteobacteria bacterium]
MATLTLPAPAKLNLFLHITGRRTDGYHNLETVFQILDHVDDITFEPAEQISVVNPLVDVMTDDLCYRAAVALQRHANTERGATIHVNKRLPAGGGLGGGSSDAATVLLGLRHLWGLDVSLDELALIGLSLGADVPIFVRGHSAFAQGVGEQITPLALPEFYYCVVTPDVHASTQQWFSDKRLTRNSEPVKMHGFRVGDHFNTFEEIVSEAHPQVSEISAVLRTQEGCRFARMTGTGSSVFGCFSDEDFANNAAINVAKLGKVFVAKGVNQSPLHLALGIVHNKN